MKHFNDDWKTCRRRGKVRKRSFPGLDQDVCRSRRATWSKITSGFTTWTLLNQIWTIRTADIVITSSVTSKRAIPNQEPKIKIKLAMLYLYRLSIVSHASESIQPLTGNLFFFKVVVQLWLHYVVCLCLVTGWRAIWISFPTTVPVKYWAWRT